jgi:histone deacetylase complex subunit SAP18
MDATLSELMTLIKEVKADARNRFTTFSFATVFPDSRRGGFRVKEIGTTCGARKSPEDNVSLGSLGFQIGDFIDVAIDPRRGPFRRY